MRKPSAKVILSRSKFDKLTIGVADGMSDWAQSVITEAGANAPDSPYDPFPTGEGLPKQGGVLAFVGNLKTFGWSLRGVQPKKPRSLRLVAKEHSVVVAGGFGFPARFVEGGTVRTRPQPFLAPVVRRRENQIPMYVARVTKPLTAKP